MNYGGPAFPQARVTVLAEDEQPIEAASVTHDGMTLRDYFAAKALQGFCARDVGLDLRNANDAYRMADAMLKARGE